LAIPRAKEAKPKTVEVKAKKAIGPGKKGTKRVTKKTVAKKRDSKREA